MCTIRLRKPDGTVRELFVAPGTPLMDLIEPGYVDMPCGGAGRCGKCRISVSGAFSAPDEDEKCLLGGELSNGVRLACKVRIMGDADVILTGDRAVQEIQSDGLMPDFPLDPLFSRYGVAVDIGTTTLSARLYDRSGRLLASASDANPQRIYGADVISRIEKSLAGERDALAACVRECINGLILSMAAEAGIASEEIDMVVLTGNTTMLYLLTARDPDCLARAPFIADELFGRDVLPEELFLRSVPNAGLYLPRCMSAFVGADITTALLASRICEHPGKALLVDIGTNGEMALWDGEKLRCCSTAAGPVFEGAEISQGMQGRSGAIDQVSIVNGSIFCHVIGGGQAHGICGSGVIDAAAAMLDLEIVDETGFMEEETFPLTPEVSITAKDIRMVQLAKGAICAGLLTLLDTRSMLPKDLDRLAIAGGFGSYLNLRSASRIGLFPAELERKAIVLGNAALSGASMILLNRGFLERSHEMASRSETVELSISPVFTEHYMECLEF